MLNLFNQHYNTSISTNISKTTLQRRCPLSRLKIKITITNLASVESDKVSYEIKFYTPNNEIYGFIGIYHRFDTSLPFAFPDTEYSNSFIVNSFEVFITPSVLNDTVLGGFLLNEMDDMERTELNNQIVSNQQIRQRLLETLNPTYPDNDLKIGNQE